MRLRNLNEKYPFQRFVFSRAADRMAVLAWIFVAVLALPMPECRASAENNDSLPKWEEVIDKLMEETAWTSIDGKTNYMEMTSSDMEAYQDTYNLDTNGPNEDWIGFWESGYPIIGKRMDIGSVELDWDEAGMVDSVYFELGYEREKIKKLKLRTRLCTGLYPDLCGIRLGDGYEEVCQILGIEEEMLNSLPDNSSDAKQLETISWDEYTVYGITNSESGSEQLHFCKGKEGITLLFEKSEDAPADEDDLFLGWIIMSRKQKQ